MNFDTCRIFSQMQMIKNIEVKKHFSKFCNLAFSEWMRFLSFSLHVSLKFQISAWQYKVYLKSDITGFIYRSIIMSLFSVFRDRNYAKNGPTQKRCTKIVDNLCPLCFLCVKLSLAGFTNNFAEQKKYQMQKMFLTKHKS